jgi:hypothetical protein
MRFACLTHLQDRRASARLARGSDRRKVGLLGKPRDKANGRLWREVAHSPYGDECALILSNDDFKATAFGGGFN